MKSLATQASALLVLWLASTCAFATSSLSFEGSGYWIDMEIGADRDPVIASIRFHKPNDPRGVVLPSTEWHVETLDTRRQVLVLRHKTGSSGIAPFTLSVQRQHAVLAIGGRKIESVFRWGQ